MINLSKSIKKQTFMKTLFLMILSSIITVMSMHMFLLLSGSDENYDAADSAAEFAQITIDADNAKKYLTSRKIDDEYENTLEKLTTYVKNLDQITSISLVSFSNSVGHIIYDTDSNKIGTKIPYDQYTNSVKSDLIDGRKSWRVTQNKYMFTYRPIRTIDDKLTGYIIVKSSEKHNVNYFIMICAGIILVFAVSTLLSKLLMNFFKKEIFNPILSFSKTALDFTGNVSNAGNIKTIELFKTNKDNEIGYLGNAINKMILDINDSTENLSNAIYEATHDGMTQLFNKRHYNNMCTNFKKAGSICVIYFDVNNLKLMNDTLGHEHGDYVIKKAAEYIRNLYAYIDKMIPGETPVSNNCFSFRMGGDEFLFVMSECTFKQIDVVIEKIEADTPVILSKEEDSVKCALSYGYSYAKGIFSYDTLLTEAEDNMYKTKNKLKKALNMPDR